MRETRRDESQNVLSTQKLFKTRDLELPMFRDLSQVVRRTPWIHPYLCTPVLPRVYDSEEFFVRFLAATFPGN